MKNLFKEFVGVWWEYRRGLTIVLLLGVVVFLINNLRSLDSYADTLEMRIQRMQQSVENAQDRADIFESEYRGLMERTVKLVTGKHEDLVLNPKADQHASKISQRLHPAAARFNVMHGGITVTPYGTVVKGSARDVNGYIQYKTKDGRKWQTKELADGRYGEVTAVERPKPKTKLPDPD